MRVLDCDFLDNSQESLNCYANNGPIESKVLDSVAFNASKLYSSLGQEVEQLQFTRELCFNISRRNYEPRSGNTYQDLQSCLMGLSPVPEITTTTTTTTEPTTTTTEPTTTTTEPTTTTTVLISSSTDEVTTTTTISPSTIAHFGSDEGNSAHSAHQRKGLKSIFRHIF
ncbi:zinc metalloproteinase nas-14 [Drosophila ficusphila]|uniref:zinc metalloproteinase nas-14 n=1 Tax=Drosophila ficusphila TaxID=30025 RepID=UPI001C8A5E5D|nr:zinc metalloproteinase nas-14 [Drosophila ficusphila]